MLLVVCLMVGAGAGAWDVGQGEEPSGLCEGGVCSGTLPDGVFQHCAADPHSSGSFMLALPEPPVCAKSKTKAKGQERVVNATIFSPNPSFPTAKAFVCQAKCIRLCRSVGFLGTAYERRLPCEEPAEGLSVEGCWELGETRSWKGHALIPVDASSASTQLAEGADWGAWPGWEECRDVRTGQVSDVVVRETVAWAELDAEGKLKASLPAVPEDPRRLCAMSSCVSGGERLVWNASAFGLWEPFVAAGTWEGRLKGTLLLVPELDMALSLDPSLPAAPAALGDGALLSVEGPAVVVRVHGEGLGLHGDLTASLSVGHRGSEASLEELLRRGQDPVNAKLSYEAAMEEERLERDFEREHAELCKLRQDKVRSLKNQAAQGAATQAARELLGRSDVAAELAGDVLFVHPCHAKDVQAVFADHRLPGETACRLFTPVLLRSRQVLFLEPGSRDLRTHSPLVDCAGVRRAVFRLASGKFSRPGVALLGSADLESEARALAGTHLAFGAPPAFESRTAHSAAASAHLASSFALSEERQRVVEASAVARSNHPSQLKQFLSGVAEVMVAGGQALGAAQKGAWEGIGDAVSKVETAFLTPLEHITITLIIGGVVAIVLLGALFIKGKRSCSSKGGVEGASKQGESLGP